MGFVRSLLALFLALLVSGVSTSAVLILPPPTPQDPLAPKILSSKGQSLDPVFSPDGKFIAYSSNLYGDFDIWLMTVDGRNQVRLTCLEGDEKKPQFSPDGMKIAFIHSSNFGEDIWVVNRDGSNPVKITNNHTPKNKFEWSPNGYLIIYDTIVNDKWQVWLTSLNKGINIFVGDSEERYAPSWSRNGKFAICVNKGVKGYSLELIDVSTNSVEKIYTTSAVIKYPSFFSADEKILFLRGNGDWSVYTFNIGNSRITNLFADPLRYYAGIPWTPILESEVPYATRTKASELLFVGYSKQGAELFILYDDIEIDFKERGVGVIKGSIIERLFTIGHTRINSLSWSQDGHSILLSFTEGGYNILSLLVLEKKKVSPYEK